VQICSAQRGDFSAEPKIHHTVLCVLAAATGVHIATKLVQGDQKVSTHLITIQRLDWLATGLPHKHLGLYCVDPLCAACVCFPPSTPGAPAPLRACGPLMEEPQTVSGRTEPSISEEEKRRARSDRSNFVLSIRLPRNRKRSFTCRKSTTRDPQPKPPPLQWVPGISRG
jgi:hypothetical protein